MGPGSVLSQVLRHRLRLPLALVAVTALAVAALPPVESARAVASQPNVVVVMTDDQTYEQLRVMPQINEFFDAKGTAFDSFVSSYPLCCPSRATFLTGQYALNHGVLSNTEPRGGYPALDSDNTLPLWLQDAGYRTTHIGKYLNGTPAEEIPPGWDDWQGMEPPNYYDYVINDNGTLVSYGSDPEDYSTDVIADRAVDSINEAVDLGDPFLTYIAPYAPHTLNGGPAAPAPRHVGMFDDEPMPMGPGFNEADVSDKPAYIEASPLMTSSDVADVTERYQKVLESLQAVDEMFGRIVGTLDDAGVLEDTVVMFTSDNGQMHGEHRQQRGKGVPYEESIRMPLLVAGPGFPAGAHVAEQTANVDLAPTIVALAGARAERVMDGVDLRSVVLSPTSFADRAVLIERYEGDCFEGVRTPTYMYARHHSGEEELYDLRVDRAEINSLHADPDYAAVKADLAARVDAFLAGGFPPCSLPPLGVSVGDATVTEARKGKVSVSVPLTMSQLADGPVTVGYVLNPGTASAEDFKERSGTVTVAQGRTASSIAVDILPDKLAESNEAFEVEITSVSPDFAVERGVGTVTIRSSGSGISALSIGDVATVEGDIRLKAADLTYVTVGLTKKLSEPVVIDWSTANGTAMAGSDYVAATGQITIAAGASWAHIPVQLVGSIAADTESDEAFTVNMSTTSALVQITDATGKVTIYSGAETAGDPTRGQ